MNKVFRYSIRALLCLLPLSLLAAGCGKQEGPDGGDTREVTLTVRFPVQTRANYTAELSDELLVRSGYLLVFDSDGFLEMTDVLSSDNEQWSWDSSTGTGTDVLRVGGGAKSYCVLFNTDDPSSLGINTLSDLSSVTFSLSDEVSGTSKYFQMWGYCKSSGGTAPLSVSVDVKRIASRVALRSVRNSHPDGHSVTLNRAWLSNVAGDHVIESLTSEATSVSTWYNIQGRSDRVESHIIDGSSYTAALPLLTYKSIGRTISNGSSYSVASSPLLFYCYPNPSTEDNAGFTSSAFSGEYTVLVLDTTVDGVTHYYSVPLNITPSGRTYPLESNRSYAVDVVISGNGSPDPNDPDGKVETTPQTADCQVTITVEDWVSGADYTETI